MEFALAGGMAGLGFLLNKDGKKERQSNIALNSTGYVQDNIYHSKYHDVVKKKEEAAGVFDDVALEVLLPAVERQQVG